MRISNEIIEQIKEFEGCSQKAYLDVAGIPTIGIGHTGKDVVMGDIISMDEANRLFRMDCARFEAALNSLNKKMLDNTRGYGGLSQNQYDALFSLIYNCGTGAIGASSTLYRLLTNGSRSNYPAICHAFMLWTKITNPKTGKKEVCGGKDGKHGLVLRRATEAAWYVYGSRWKEKINDVVEWARS